MNLCIGSSDYHFTIWSLPEFSLTGYHLTGMFTVSLPLFVLLTFTQGMNITVVTVAFTNSPTYGYDAMMPTYDAIFAFVRRKYPSVYSRMKRLPSLNLAQYIPNDGSYPCTAAYEIAMQYFGAYYHQHTDIFQGNSNVTFPFILTADWCDDAQTELAKFATAANIFLLSLNPANGPFAQFQNFPIMTELGPIPGAKMVAGVTAVLLKFGWTKNLGFWCPTYGMAWPFIFCDIFIQSDLYNKIGAEQFHIADPETKDFSRKNYRMILNDMRYRTRVILVFLFPRLLREFMITAHDMNMTNGDYVFLTLGFETSPDSPYPLTWRAGDKDDEKAFQAYQSLIASSDALVNWTDVADFVRERARISADVYNITLPPERMRNQATALMYDLLTIFAEGVNRSLGNAAYFHPEIFAKRLKEQMYGRDSSSTKLGRTGSATFRVPILRLNTQNGEIEQAGVLDTDSEVLIIQNNQIWTWHNGTTFPSNEPVCGFDGQSCPNDKGNLTVTLLVIVLCAIIIIAFGAVWFYRRKAKQLAIEHLFLNISKIFVESSDCTTIKGLVDGRHSVSCYETTLQLEHQAVYIVRLSNSTKTSLRSGSSANILLTMHRLANENVAQFYGVVLDDVSGTSYLMSEYTQRGSLWDAVMQKNIMSDMPIRLSFLLDLIRGLLYIHNSHLHYHGSLSAQVCFISSRFTLKISQAGYQRLFNLVSADNQEAGSRVDDIVQFGKICRDVLNETDVTAAPAESKLTALINDCVNVDSASRLSCQKILKVFRTLPKLPRNIISHMLSLLDRQTYDLEEAVRLKTADLVEEMRKSDSLLAEMLPKSIIQRLRNKEKIEAETFQSASILFSDIPTFGDLLSRCTPIELINLLNDTHSKFDGLVHEFDAYKVETIGDCYMISSGLPVRSQKHAAELCFLAHTLLKASCSFQVASAQDVELTARIGINSGQVVAGVVGTKSPRYCLFGDTVNTASRMESTGCVGKVHVSQSTHDEAVKNPLLRFEDRGEIIVKGKGAIRTYWLGR